MTPFFCWKPWKSFSWVYKTENLTQTHKALNDLPSAHLAHHPSAALSLSTSQPRGRPASPQTHRHLLPRASTHAFTPRKPALPGCLLPALQASVGPHSLGAALLPADPVCWAWGHTHLCTLSFPLLFISLPHPTQPAMRCWLVYYLSFLLVRKTPGSRTHVSFLLN